jgi:hypothetical protein
MFTIKTLEYALPEPSGLMENLVPIFLGLLLAIFLHNSRGKSPLSFIVHVWFIFVMLWQLCAFLPFAAAALPTSILLHPSAIAALGTIASMLFWLLLIPVASKPVALLLHCSLTLVVYFGGIHLFNVRKDMMWALQPEDAPLLSPAELVLFASRWGLISIIFAVTKVFILRRIMHLVLLYIKNLGVAEIASKSADVLARNTRYVLDVLLYVVSPLPWMWRMVKLCIIPSVMRRFRWFKAGTRLWYSLFCAVRKPLPRSWVDIKASLEDPHIPIVIPYFFSRRVYRWYGVVKKYNPVDLTQHPYDTWASFADAPVKFRYRQRPFEPEPPKVSEPIPPPPPVAPVVPREPLSIKARRFIDKAISVGYLVASKLKRPPPPRDMKRKKRE